MKRKLERSFMTKISDRSFEHSPQKEWEVLFATRSQMPKATWGDCNRKKKRLRVRTDLSDLNFLDTMIHEIRHAQHPVMFEAEEFISDTSTEIARILLESGRVIVLPQR